MEKQKELSAQRARWLFENHVEFLTTHRGRVEHLQDAFAVKSDRPEFTYAVLGKGADKALLDQFSTVHLIPWSEPWTQQLDDVRFQAKGGLSYMIFDGDASTWKQCQGLEIIHVSDEGEMDDFTHAQAASFAPNQEDYDQWHPWLRKANHKNLENHRQHFYVGYLNGKPVGTTLLVLTKELGGIYAVATLPEFRKKGVGSSLMARAVADARSKGCKMITLQVIEGSYAEALYKKLGFITTFSATILSRRS